jgi:hypothetical protein
MKQNQTEQGSRAGEGLRDEAHERPAVLVVAAVCDQRVRNYTTF